MILYIHGFASSSLSNKVKLLRERFGEVVAFDLSVAPRRAVKKLEAFIEEQYDKTNITLIGSSLGGFYAIYISQKYDLKAVLINPSINPDKTLAQYKDQKVKNYSKNDVFIFRAHYLKQLEELKIATVDSSKYLLLLQTGDETLDYKEALAFLPDAKSIVVSGGTHQFEDFQNYFEIIDTFHNGTSKYQTSNEKPCEFTLTVKETNRVMKWAETINQELTEDDHECLGGGGIAYTFAPFVLGTMIEVKYYGKTLLVRLGMEDSIKK